MPKELRKLTFSENEMRRAIYDYCLRSNLPISRTAISMLTVSPDPAATVTLRFEKAGLDEEKKFKLTREQVGAALIRYCRECGIPLPRDSEKILQVHDGEVALMVHVPAQSA